MVRASLNVSNDAVDSSFAYTDWYELPRRYAGCTTAASAQTSDSATPPPASKMPTTVQVFSPQRWVRPISSSANWLAAARPTMISFLPSVAPPPWTLKFCCSVEVKRPPPPSTPAVSETRASGLRFGM